MLRIPRNEVIPRNKQERKRLDAIEGKRLELFQRMMLLDLRNAQIPEVKPTVSLDLYPISQKKSEYSQLPYGKVSDIADAGCGLIAVEYAYRANGIQVDFPELVKEVVEKGYRAYVYDNDDNIVDGSGTEYALFDNLGIRLSRLSEILECLKAQAIVCILIQNSVYHQDEKKLGNHFVILLGIDNDKNAIIMDGNKITDTKHPEDALVRKPFEKMALGIRAAWKFDKKKLETFVSR